MSDTAHIILKKTTLPMFTKVAASTYAVKQIVFAYKNVKNIHKKTLSTICLCTKKDPKSGSRMGKYCNFLFLLYVACPAGFEPATVCLEGRCSIQLSYATKCYIVGVAGFEPATSCSQSRRDDRATLHPDLVAH